MPLRIPPSEDVRAQLRKILDSEALAGSDQLKRLLQVAVERTASGQSESLKEYTLGVEAFGRSADYDPKIDPIVRVQARRLRTKLDEYYASEGVGDSLRITLPKGGYVPAFEVRAMPSRHLLHLARALVATAILLILALAWLLIRNNRTAADAQSIAVLPLRNIAEDSSRQFLADRATEALLTSLARIPGVRVVSGTTTRSLANVHQSLPEIAKALNVRWVVEGAVGQENDRILVKMRLVDATSDRKVWADAITCTEAELSTRQQSTAIAMAAVIGRVQAQPPHSTPEHPRSLGR